MANGLAAYWQERGEFHLVRPVTRLDKDTSGLIVFAKHPHAHAILSGQMKGKRYLREYLAVVHGSLEKEEGKGGGADCPFTGTSSYSDRLPGGGASLHPLPCHQAVAGGHTGSIASGDGTDTSDSRPYGSSGTSAFG